MAKVTKTCRVCGRQYEACHTPNTTGVFRWRDVACSIECGRIYLERIEASRKPAVQENKMAEVAEPVNVEAERVETEIAENISESEDMDIKTNEETETFIKKRSTKKATS